MRFSVAASIALVLAASLAPNPLTAQVPVIPPGSDGWRVAGYPGMPPAQIELTESSVRLLAEPGSGGFIWHPLQGAPGCLSWRWRVHEGPPPTDLTRAGGDDRAIGIYVGFDGLPPGATLTQRARRSIAEAMSGDQAVPQSVLTYVWGGTGREPRFYDSPHMPGIFKGRVMRPADAPRGRWFEEQVDLGADWRTAFGGDPPPLLQIAIGTDTDQTRTRVQAEVADIRFGPCR